MSKCSSTNHTLFFMETFIIFQINIRIILTWTHAQCCSVAVHSECKSASVNESCVWSITKALLCLLCRPEGVSSGSAALTVQLLMFMLPLFVLHWCGMETATPCLFARVSVRISLGGSWDTSHHCPPPLFITMISMTRVCKNIKGSNHGPACIVLWDKIVEFNLIDSFHVTLSKITDLHQC